MQNNRYHLFSDINLNNKFPIKMVAIETKGECTRRCSYCPVSKVKPRKGELNISVIESIFIQLQKLYYEGELRLHYYNEPLLDSRIFTIITKMRRYLPNNFFRLTTNGDLLDKITMRAFIDEGVTQVKVSAHDKQTEEKVKTISKELGLDQTKKIMITPYYKGFKVVNRGGAITSHDINNISCELVHGANHSGCNRLEMNIDYEGNVYPCCHSFDGTYLLGSVLQNSLKDLYINNMSRYRDHYVGKFSQRVCRKCVGLE